MKRDRGELGLSVLFLVLALVCFIVGGLIAHGSIQSDEGITWLFGGLICWVLAILLPSFDRRSP